MLKIFRDAPPVKNVVSGQLATLDLDIGWRYHAIRLIATVANTQSAATEPTLDQAIGTITALVNGDPKRTHIASYLNAIQKKWNAGLAATLYTKTANDLLTTVNDSTANSLTTRTSTWVLDVWLAEPTRDNYQAKQAFGWPTQWNNAAVGNFAANYSAKIQFQVQVPAGGGVPGTTAGLSSPVIRAEMMVDNAAGPVVGVAGARGPGVIGTDLLQRAGIVAPPVGSPIMPITHWYQFPEDYSSTALVIRDWPWSGGTLQELDLFCQSGDDVGSFTVLTDNAIKRKSTKASNDQMNVGWGWNSSYGAGTAGNDYVAADLFAMAFDFDDDPGSALSSANYNTLELDLTLTAASASNKSIIFIAHVYRNGLLL
ncbi:MAG TPA: hypothetical protein VH280_14855 [Verrucomicrobiae bacterium]|jgi:hypothetical protein|nr:hypothetical protein [Verrucomicrobiae bacterium]